MGRPVAGGAHAPGRAVAGEVENLGAEREEVGDEDSTSVGDEDSTSVDGEIQQRARLERAPRGRWSRDAPCLE